MALPKLKSVAIFNIGNKYAVLFTTNFFDFFLDVFHCISPLENLPQKFRCAVRFPSLFWIKFATTRWYFSHCLSLPLIENICAGNAPATWNVP